MVTCFSGRFAQKLNATDGTSRTIQPSSLNLTQDMILSELNQLRAMLTESALSGEFNVNYTAGQLLNVFDVQFEGDVDRPKFSCPAGSIPVKADNSTNEFARCVYCPVGTFFNVVNEVCESCSQGSYQPEEGQLSCLVCPNNTSTKVVNAKRSDDCQGSTFKFIRHSGSFHYGILPQIRWVSMYPSLIQSIHWSF